MIQDAYIVTHIRMMHFTLFECHRWVIQSERLGTEVGHITHINIIEVILSTEKRWDKLAAYIEVVLHLKIGDENKINARYANYSVNTLVVYWAKCD